MLIFDDDGFAATASVGLAAGPVLTVRQVRDGDADALQDYMRTLAVGSRYSRMLGAASEWPASEMAAILHPPDPDHVALLATVMIDGCERIVGEARLVHEPQTERVELALSVSDRWQRQGLGAALLRDLQRRAATLGPVALFGDTLRSNAAMLGLAKASGFSFQAIPADWRLIRFSKPVAFDRTIVRHDPAGSHVAAGVR